jgi:cytoskeletal protein CcmA (bactofilin family)
LSVRDAEIAGELVADLTGTGTVVLKPSARFFGNISSVGLVVEAGAVFVGSAKVGNHTP